jgi:hypothetical protein
MLIRPFVLWIALAAILGAALGVSLNDWSWQTAYEQTTNQYPNAHSGDSKQLSTIWHWATHDAVAVFTLLVALITGVLAYVTYGLYRVTAQLARESRVASDAALKASTEHTQTLFNIERAYLVGGGQVAVAGKTFQVEFSNYGKTPAFIYAFDIEFATLVEVETGPREVFPMRYFEDVIPPHPGGNTPQRKVSADIDPPNAEVAYGAFWYEDWQKHVHLYRFILKIVPGVSWNGSTSVSLPGIDPSYIYRD